MAAPARMGSELYTADGSKRIGSITSGTFSPTLRKPIAMGFVEKEFSKAGTPVSVSVRGKMREAKITRMPFVETKYYKK